jgi:hypothetical protein
MKERPILFSAPMVRAILAGTKTQTRRAVRGLDIVGPDKDGIHDIRRQGKWAGAFALGETRAALGCCPYGVKGDRLWVRETFIEVGPGNIGYGITVKEPIARYRAEEPDLTVVGGWRPSIFMPRKHSRITLEVTDIRVERLQDISYEDALAEGAMDAAAFCESGEIAKVTSATGETAEDTARRLRWPQRDYEAIWTRINGPGSWDANPWVWAITFRRVEC